MTTQDREDRTQTRASLAEDLLLLLFQPGSGTIAGENTLFYVLGGAVLSELVQSDRVSVEDGGLRGHLIRATGETAPDDTLLAQTWDYVDRPRNVQTVLAAMGPTLRAPLLDRLVERGDIRRSTGKMLGIFPTTTLEPGDAGRRTALVDAVRAVLVEGADPDERTASLIALLSASGSLPALHAEIPWTATVASRAQALQRGDDTAGAAGEAITRTVTAIAVNAAVAAAVAASVLPHN